MSIEVGRRGHHNKFAIRIDGRPFIVEGHHHTAAALLGLAGLPPAGYNLTRVGHRGRVENFRDQQEVDVKDGDVFVSVNQQGTVA